MSSLQVHYKRCLINIFPLWYSYQFFVLSFVKRLLEVYKRNVYTLILVQISLHRNTQSRQCLPCSYFFLGQVFSLISISYFVVNDTKWNFKCVPHHLKFGFLGSIINEDLSHSLEIMPVVYTVWKRSIMIDTKIKNTKKSYWNNFQHSEDMATS